MGEGALDGDLKAEEEDEVDEVDEPIETLTGKS